MSEQTRATEPSEALLRLARNLAELMDRGRYSQRDLGRLVGVSQPMISKWVKAQNEPSFDQAATLAQVLDVPLEVLIREDEPRLSPEALATIRAVADMIRRLGYEETHRRLLVIQQTTVGHAAGPVASVPQVVRDVPAASEVPGGKRRGRSG